MSLPDSIKSGLKAFFEDGKREKSVLKANKVDTEFESHHKHTEKYNNNSKGS